MAGRRRRLLPPLAGAIVQEVIDVLAIANALRAVTPGASGWSTWRATTPTWAGGSRPNTKPSPPACARSVHSPTTSIASPPAEALERLCDLRSFLDQQLLPHELAEDRDLYPVVARVLGGTDPTAPMSRMHIEIAHLIGLYGRLVDGLDPAGPDDDDVRELRRVLYSLDAVLRLHMAQEEQEYLSLADTAPGRGSVHLTWSMSSNSARWPLSVAAISRRVPPWPTRTSC